MQAGPRRWRRIVRSIRTSLRFPLPGAARAYLRNSTSWSPVSLWLGAAAVTPPRLPLQGAGESHVDLRLVLRQLAIWILRRTPESQGGFDAEIRQDFQRFAGSTRAEYGARIARRPCHRAGCGAVRGEMCD